jgi:hypothetical protein
VDSEELNQNSNPSDRVTNTLLTPTLKRTHLTAKGKPQQTRIAAPCKHTAATAKGRQQPTLQTHGCYSKGKTKDGSLQETVAYGTADFSRKDTRGSFRMHSRSQGRLRLGHNKWLLHQQEAAPTLNLNGRDSCPNTATRKEAAPANTTANQN